MEIMDVVSKFNNLLLNRIKERQTSLQSAMG